MSYEDCNIPLVYGLYPIGWALNSVNQFFGDLSTITETGSSRFELELTNCKRQLIFPRLRNPPFIKFSPNSKGSCQFRILRGVQSQEMNT